jgi:hypothetical protein
MRAFATELATTLRRSGFETQTTDILQQRLLKLDNLHARQKERNDPQITHTIADMNAIKLVHKAPPSPPPPPASGQFSSGSPSHVGYALSFHHTTEAAAAVFTQFFSALLSYSVVLCHGGLYGRMSGECTTLLEV